MSLNTYAWEAYWMGMDEIGWNPEATENDNPFDRSLVPYLWACWRAGFFGLPYPPKKW